MFEDLNNNSKLKDDLDLEAKILEAASHLRVPGTVSKKEALERLKLRIENSKEDKTAVQLSSRIKMSWVYSAAATIVLIVGTWTFFSRFGTTNIVAPKGQQIEYTLPDGTTVSINAQSKISFRKRDFKRNRFVKLEGEAFFNVKKGSGFVIKTEFADVKVLGTSFNIFARGTSFKVSCVTGRVQVQKNSELVVLAPGESAVTTNSHLKEFEDENITTVTNWRLGEFYFVSAPLIDVLEEIERQFNVTFTHPDLANKFFTGDFSNKNLVDALDVVCIPMGLDYEIGTNSKIQIRNKSD